MPRPAVVHTLVCLLAIIATLAPGCKRNQASRSGQASPASADERAAADKPAELPAACRDLPDIPLRYPAADRVVALGDLHGDLSAARAALRLAGAIDEDDRWIGGDLVVVQTGDVLDRGDGEQAIIDLFERLRGEARAAGGAVIPLNGNHELMNADGNFSDATPGGFADFEDAPGVAEASASAGDLAAIPDAARARVAAFRPGGPYARILADRNVVAIVGDTVFVHGGVLPAAATYGLDRLNREVRCWLRGDGPRPDVIIEPDSPVWSRHYSSAIPACDQLAVALDALGAARMVVGHTPQIVGANAVCDGKVWRIDVGMSSFYGGPIQVLELRGQAARVLQ